jgi:hypothetical protein
MIRWAGHVAHIGKRKTPGKDNIKMDHIYMMGGCRLHSSGSGQGQMVGSCDYSTKLPGSKIAGNL